MYNVTLTINLYLHLTNLNIDRPYFTLRVWTLISCMSVWHYVSLLAWKPWWWRDFWFNLEKLDSNFVIVQIGNTQVHTEPNIWFLVYWLDIKKSVSQMFYLVFLHRNYLVCSSVRPSARLSRVNMTYNYLAKRDKAFILHMYDPSDTTVLFVP